MKTLACWLPLFCIACSERPLPPNVDDLPSISTGVYGEVWTGCDTPDCVAAPDSGVLVALVQPRISTAENVAVFIAENEIVARTQSRNGDGFFEISAAPSGYSLCVYWWNPSVGANQAVKCTDVTIVQNQRTRHLYTFGPGGGLWN